MPISLKYGKEHYSEEEAAESLGISPERLHHLLDQHIFCDGSPKPSGITFRVTDLLMLGIWHRADPNLSNLVKMPRR